MRLEQIVAVAALVLVAHATVPWCVRADDEACRDDLSDTEVHARLASLELVVDQGTVSSRWWWWGWLAALSAIAIAQTTIAIGTSDRPTRVDMVVGAIVGWLGVAATAVFPLESAFARGRLDDALERTPAERLAKLRLAEQTVASASDGQAFGVSWVPHTLNLTVAIGSGLYLWLAEERLVSGLVQTGATIVVAEAQILTQPTSARDGWAAYRARYRTLACRPAAARPQQVQVALGVAPGGVGLSLRW